MTRGKNSFKTFFFTPNPNPTVHEKDEETLLLTTEKEHLSIREKLTLMLDTIDKKSAVLNPNNRKFKSKKIEGWLLFLQIRYKLLLDKCLFFHSLAAAALCIVSCAVK